MSDAFMRTGKLSELVDSSAYSSAADTGVAHRVEVRVDEQETALRAGARGVGQVST